jgi:hypothetical protein
LIQFQVSFAHLFLNCEKIIVIKIASLAYLKKKKVKEAIKHGET